MSTLDMIRDATAGQLLRLAFKSKWLQHPDEQSEGQYPADKSKLRADDFMPSKKDNEPKDEEDSVVSSPIRTSLDVSSENDVERGISSPIPNKSSQDEIILVGWSSDKDPANPQNWSTSKKSLLTAQIWYELLKYPPVSLVPH